MPTAAAAPLQFCHSLLSKSRQPIQRRSLYPFLGHRSTSQHAILTTFAYSSSSIHPKAPTSITAAVPNDKRFLSNKRLSMLAYVEVIGSGSSDCSSSIQLFFNDGRYLFECGDGTQRLCAEYGTRLSKTIGIYLSTVTAPSVGGLFGLLLTVADIGKETLSIAAPTGLNQLFSSSRFFFYRPNLDSTLLEIDTNKPPSAIPIAVTEDDRVKIQAVPVNARRDTQIDTSFGMHCDAVSYICRLHNLPGKFDPQKALRLGVKKGRMFGSLQRGTPVQLDDGTEVKSEQVMSPSTPGPIVLIVACPSIDHIDSLTSCAALQPDNLGLNTSLQNHSNKNNNKVEAPPRTCVICHLAPRHVLSHSAYRNWCDEFGDSVTHIPLHSTMARKQTIYASQAEDMALLHFSLDKELYPIPHDCLLPNSLTSEYEHREKSEEKITSGYSLSTKPVKGGDENWALFKDWKGKWVGAESKLKYYLAPTSNIGIDRSAVRNRYIECKPTHALMNWRETTPPYASEPEPAGCEIATPACITNLQPRTVAVRFLGTGAALPSKRRNVSATLLDLYARGSVLLDCGEGTWGQMVRMFGREEAQQILAHMKVIFISHMHADHHLGLMSILHQRSTAMAENPDLRHGPQLVIIGPCHLHSWLEGFQQAARVPLRDQQPCKSRPYRFFDAASLTDPQTADCKFFADAFGLDFGCVNVIHCPLSYGVVIRDCISGWKVVFSGDTRPSEALAEAGKGATLAIHEATLEDELSDEALEKKHSTTSEALKVCADDMKAWRTVLTHFSQRYPKIPRLDDRVMKKLYNSRATIACDLMTVDFSHLQDLPRITSSLRDCFPDEVEQWTNPGLRKDEQCE